MLLCLNFSRLLLFLGFFAIQTPAQALGPGQESSPWIVSASIAQKRYAAGDLLLDARPRLEFKESHLLGSHSIQWLDFTQQGSGLGILLQEDKELERRLQELGVRADQGILVVDDPVRGWGEAGRIVWMLRSLGHPNVAFVDGGWKALFRAGVPQSKKVGMIWSGDFQVRRKGKWTIERSTLKALLSDSEARERKPHLVDARSKEEYEGATPYGEPRAGHVAGAISLPYQELLGQDGRLLPRKELLALLCQHGLDPEVPVVAYCTGGVRSAWIVGVLLDLGWKEARNYPGSMLDWAAGPSEDYPLTLSKKVH